MNRETVLELAHISKHFGKLIANDDISLTLGKGELLALLGENGAGKTTLMNVLFGHYTADGGDRAAWTGAFRAQTGRSQAARAFRAFRPAGGAGCLCCRSFRRREATGGDTQGALSRCAHSHPG